MNQNHEPKHTNIFYSHVLLYKIQPTLGVVRAGGRHDADTADSRPAAQRYGWSVEIGGSLYTAPGVTGSFEASAT